MKVFVSMALLMALVPVLAIPFLVTPEKVQKIKALLLWGGLYKALLWSLGAVAVMMTSSLLLYLYVQGPLRIVGLVGMMCSGLPAYFLVVRAALRK